MAAKRRVECPSCVNRLTHTVAVKSELSRANCLIALENKKKKSRTTSARPKSMQYKTICIYVFYGLDSLATANSAILSFQRRLGKDIYIRSKCLSQRRSLSLYIYLPEHGHTYNKQSQGREARGRHWHHHWPETRRRQSSSSHRAVVSNSTQPNPAHPTPTNSIRCHPHIARPLPTASPGRSR